MHKFLGLALSSALLIHGALALPAESSSGASTSSIFSREVKYDKSCSGKIPHDPKGRTYQQKAEKAFADAAEMASVALTGKTDKGVSFTDSQAFKHYFTDDQKGTVTKMMNVVKEGITTKDYDFTILCGSKADEVACGKTNLAATNPRPGHPVIVLCDAFFDPNTKQTQKDLDSLPFIDDPKRGQQSWCQAGSTPKDLEVAGLTAFHEMTHLDIVGEKAGLPEEQDGDFKTHGTFDIAYHGPAADQSKYNKNQPYYVAARKLNDLWKAHNADNKKYKPLLLQTQNAESFAAAALEFYFQTKCKDLAGGVS